MDYIRITNENIEKEHICCAMSGKQSAAKKQWLRQRFEDGLVFYRSTERGKCFIEYIPAENAWVPIEADGYLYIDCLWVSGTLKGHGYSNDLLEECIRDAKEQGRKGLCILSSEGRKREFLSDPKYMAYKGFSVADTSSCGIDLMYLPIEQDAEPPRFKACAKEPAVEEKGFVLYYTDQCPFTCYWVPQVEKAAKENNIPLKVIHITDKEQAQNVPAPVTTYALFKDGRFLTQGIQTDKKFLKLAAADPVPGKNGNKYVPFYDRKGERSVIYFTRDLSPEGLKKIYDRVSKGIEGKAAIKLHTGEPEGPNIIPRPWVKELIDERLPEATIIETNTYYEGDRYTTKAHRKTLEVNGWTFCPVDIIDEDGVAVLPVEGGKWFKEMHVGRNLLNYDSMLTLTHFKGHTMGGFGGSNKNIGIGCADGRIGKKEIHTAAGSNDQWSISKEEFMERMSESTKATIDHFKGHISYINVMRNMSVSCDCEGCSAEPVVTPDIGIFAGFDILAVDNACIDAIYSLPDGGKTMIERVESRHGLRQLSYMKELGMGNDLYTIIDIDNNDAEITAAQITESIDPEWIPDKYNTFPGRNKMRPRV